MITKCPHDVYIGVDWCAKCFTSESEWEAFKERASNALWSALGVTEPQNAQEAADALRASMDLWDMDHDVDKPTIPS